ncbi:prepilin-type N-terminal cleavage/methylation domain-containing protein [Patescibacteria group bacterium]|nr:prepilin-type N-terminal cleavage/methylation domain-containing protein [Patescibacteria group bacterium]
MSIASRKSKGFTLVELIVSLGLFAIVLLLAAGAYLIMINLNRQAQAEAVGIDNLSFALETMTRTIRSGTQYSCNGVGDCNNPSGTVFKVHSFIGGVGQDVTFGRTVANGIGYITQNGNPLTDTTTVDVKSLTFYVSGTAPAASRDARQPYVLILIKGSVSTGPSTPPLTLYLETSAAMRGSDL